MIPDSCWSGSYPVIRFNIYRNTQAVLLKSKYYYDAYHQPYLVTSGSYSAGDTFIMEVMYDWSYSQSSSYPWKAQDYTLKMYSKQDLQIKDQNGNTNMWFMDGNYPSGFQRSHYRTQGSHKGDKDWKPRSLSDIWRTSNSVLQFLSLVFTHPHTLYTWWPY